MTTVPVFHSYPKWSLSGVGSWTVNLVNGMRHTEFDSHILFTGLEYTTQPDLELSSVPYHFLELSRPRNRQDEWSALKMFLEARAPCIYITNFDFHRSCAVGILDPSVRVVTVIHSDEACYFDELRRIGQNCNAIVCVSTVLAHKVAQLFPLLRSRIHIIPHGVPISNVSARNRYINRPLRLCFCNRLQQYQKRIFDLPVIASELERLGVAFELDIAGDGPDATELRHRFIASRLTSPIRFHGRISNAAVMDLCSNSDLFLLTSDFEGLPISLLEAMSVGCVPVVYQIESGIDDVIQTSDYGFIVPHGNTSEFAACIHRISNDREGLNLVSTNARRIIHEKFSLENMASEYIRLFRDILPDDVKLNRNGRVVVPFDLSLVGRSLRRLRSLGSFFAEKSSYL